MRGNNVRQFRELFLKIIFCMSLPFLTLLLSTKANKIEILIGMIGSLIIAIYLVFKPLKNVYKEINIKYLFGSLFISCFLERTFTNYCFPINTYITYYAYKYLGLTLPNNISLLFLILTSIPSVITLTYIFLKWFIPKAIIAYKNMKPIERKYIFSLLILGLISTTIIYNITNCFYSPKHEIPYDVIYTSDSGYLFNYNAYMNINMDENDIRQPFFGLLALPFSIIAYILSKFIFFLPNSYAIFLNTIQITLIGISFLMIAKMLNLNEKNKFLFMLFSFLTFPLILFSFMMEQYVFTLFYLILTIYIYYYKILKVNYAYIGAVGTLLTSGIIFPLISKFESLKNWIVNVFKCFIAFVCVTIVSGQLTTMLNAPTSLLRFKQFTGDKIDFIDRLKQFLYFVRSIFLAPAKTIVLGSFPAYQVKEISFICVTGIIILILCLISFILNRKNKLAIISFLWIIYSFIILCLAGWGTSENGLILYTLYFSWAFIILIYLLIDKLIKNQKIKTGVIIILCLILLVINVPEFINILKFGLYYYPE